MEAGVPVLVCPTTSFIIISVVLKMDENAIPLFFLSRSNLWLPFYLPSVSVLTVYCVKDEFRASKYALHLCFDQETKHFPKLMGVPREFHR